MSWRGHEEERGREKGGGEEVRKNREKGGGQEGKVRCVWTSEVLRMEACQKLVRKEDG